MIRNKKADLQDVFLFTILAFGIVLGGIFALKMFTVINDQFQSSSVIPAESKSVLTVASDRLPKWIDYGFIFIYIVLIIVGLFLAFQIPTTPAMFPISIIYFILLVFLSRIFKTIYTQIATTSTMTSISSQFSVIPYMIDKLPVISFIFGVLIIGIMVIRR